MDASRPEVPGFGVRDLIIVQLSRKKDHREVHIMHSGFASARIGIDSKDIVALAISAVADRPYNARTRIA